MEKATEKISNQFTVNIHTISMDLTEPHAAVKHASANAITHLFLQPMLERKQGVF